MTKETGLIRFDFPVQAKPQFLPNKFELLRNKLSKID